MGKSTIKYKFHEQEHIADLLDYIDNTYTTHYGGDIQPTEVIISSGLGNGFILGDIIKYAMRYGKKGSTPEDYRKDLQKIAHYAILALENHDRTYDATQ
jgi:hypothetical protein